MDFLSQSQQKIIQEFQNRLTKCSNQQKSINIREAQTQLHNNDGLSNDCTPEKELKPIILKNNTVQQSQKTISTLGDQFNPQIINQENQKSKSFTEHLQYQQIERNQQQHQQQSQNMVHQQYQNFIPQQQQNGIIYQQQRQYQNTNQFDNDQNQMNQNNQNYFNPKQQVNNSNYQISFEDQKQFHFNNQQENQNDQYQNDMQIQDEYNYIEENDENEEEDQDVSQNNITINNKNNESEQNGEYNQTLSSERKQNLYVVWQLNQKRNRQYSLQEDQLQKALEKNNINEYYDEQQLSGIDSHSPITDNSNLKQNQLQFQQYKQNQIGFRDKVNQIKNNKNLQDDNDEKHQSRFNRNDQKVTFKENQLIYKDKENYTPNLQSSNLEAARQQLMREYESQENQKQHPLSNEFVQKNINNHIAQNISSNRSIRALSVENKSQNMLNQQQKQTFELTKDNSQKLQNPYHLVSFGQSLNPDQIFKVDAQIERGNSQRSRLHVTSIKQIEKLITQQDSEVYAQTLNVIQNKQSPSDTKSKQQNSKKTSNPPPSSRQNLNKNLPPKALATKQCKKTKVEKIIKSIKNNGMSQKMLLDIIQEHMMECDQFLLNFEQKLIKKNII